MGNSFIVWVVGQFACYTFQTFPNDRRLVNVPDTLRLKAGDTYRLRLIHLIPDWTARIALLQGDSVLSWRALAKDGAELPSHLQTARPAELIAGPGETFDFEYRPAAPGMLRLMVMQRTGIWKMELPIRVER